MLSCSGFEADGPEECIKIIDDPVVEAVELGSPLVGDSGIGAGRAEETRSQRGVDSFEQLQEQQADRVTLRGELIAARIRKFGNETLGPQFGKIVAERGERIAFGSTSERLDDVWMDFRGGKVVAGGNVREAHESVHQGKLAGMIEPQPRNAFSRRSNGRLSGPELGTQRTRPM